MANKSPQELVAVKIIRRAHCQRITSVAVNSKFGEDSSLLVTTAEDKYVKLWDMERFEIKLAHHQHGRSNRIVSAAFAGSHKVVSVSDDGHIIVWSFNNNEKLHMTNIFNPNMTPTSMSICPHDPSLAAFGMKSGLIVVVNLEGTGQVVCHLRGHYKEVISMDWCPIPFNIFPKNPNNEVYITPEQFRAAGSEGTAALVQELMDEILDSVSILAQHALDMAGSKQSTIKDSAAAQTAPQTSTEMTPGANVEENQRLDKALPKLLDLIALSFTKPYCEKCSKEKCTCVSMVKMITATIEQARDEFLLVSSAREPTLIIWRVGSMDTMQTTVKLPPANKQKKKGNSKDKLWITVKWPVPNKIYCSSGNNELIQWTIPKAEGDGLKLIHGDHSGLIFSIATSIRDFLKTNWKIPSEHLVWTTSCDKQLICYRIDGEVAEVQKLAMYPTFAGVPECLARNEVNPFRVAIGTSGGILKIWDLTEATPKIVSMEILTQRIHTRVTCVAWHPINQHIVAFGTQKGRVGLFNLENRTGRLHVMPQCFTKQIIKIQWAPGYNDVYGLYITAEGRLVVWDAETPEAAPFDVETPVDHYVYDFDWKKDFSCLLISFQRCLVKTYSASLQDMDTFRTPHELGLLAWNPLSLTGDFSKEPFCMMSAAVLNRKTMVVLDHSRKTNQFEEKIAGKFGTKGHINVIVWNNCGTRLAIGTEDGFVFIWDLPAQATIWTYVNETFQGIVSVMFWPFGTAHVFCGTRDCVLKVFTKTQHPPLDPATLSAIEEGNEDKCQREKQKKPTELLPVYHRSRTSAVEFVADLRRLFTYVTDGVLERDANSEVDLLDIFGCRETMSQLVAQNESIMREKGEGLDVPLAMFRPDFPKFLNEAVKSRRVTPAIIALAAYESKGLWREAVEIYADALSEDPHSDAIEAATYYIACHKVYEAIDLLVSRNMFKEALALAKCRSNPGSPMVAKVIEAWAKYAFENGNFERAAECYVYLRKFGEAATALLKRTEPEIVQFAVELTEKANKKDPLPTASLNRPQIVGGRLKRSLEIIEAKQKERVGLAIFETASTASAGPSTAGASADPGPSSTGPSTSSVEDAAGPSSAVRSRFPIKHASAGPSTFSVEDAARPSSAGPSNKYCFIL